MLVLSISENILLFVSGLGVLQGVLLAAIVYYHPKSDKQVNIFLAFLIIAVSLVLSAGVVTKILPWYKNYFIVACPLATGPLLYLYIRSFRQHINFRKALPHLLPFFIFLAGSHWYLDYLRGPFVNTDEIPKDLMRNPVVITVNCLKMLQYGIYALLARRELLLYQRSIRHLFSETSRIDLGWARWLINGFIFIVLATVVMYSFMVKYPQYLNMLLLLNIALGTPYIYVASFKGIMQPSIWQSKPGANKHEVEKNMQEAVNIEIDKLDPQKPKSQKTGLNSDRLNEIVNGIIEAMEKDKLYQETELTLQDLATRLNFPAHQVSQALNDGMNKNFYDVINSYRVEEAKRLLVDPRNSNYTVLSVGYEAGFNSKTTFNTVFKKFTGQTPTVYRERHRSRHAAMV